MDDENSSSPEMNKVNCEYYLKQLGHHKNVHTESDTNGLNVPDASKVAWRYVKSQGIEVPPEDEFMDDLGTTALGGDSDLESPGDMDIEALEHAGVWTDTEAVRMHLGHLSKLKNAYISEMEHLKQFLRRSRMQYLKDVAIEKEYMSSIHTQSKNIAKDKEDYETLKALQRYHRHYGKEAILRQKLVEKRAASVSAATLDTSTSKDKVLKNLKNCNYNQGSWKCGEVSIPLAKHCVKHILEDTEQVLYRACGSTDGGGESCSTAIILLPHITTCIFHTPLPDIKSLDDI